MNLAIAPFLNKLNQFIINPLIIFVFALALLYFLWGVFEFIKNSDSDDKGEGKRKILWGLVGMFIMFAAYGIIRIILGTFGITSTPYITI